MGYPYSERVNLKRNVVRTLGLLVLASVALLGSGCGGIGAGGSVSPATFLLPGIGQTEPEHSSPAASEQSAMTFQKKPQIAADGGEAVP